MRNLCSPRNLAASFLCAALAAGCGKSEEKKGASQVAARVNGYEITIHQVNNVLARQNVRPERAEEAKRQALERLIDQQVARQQAVERKLDRAPTAVQALEAARSEILAGMYLQQLAASQPASTAEEVKKFYAEHPELFAQRQLFALEEISLPATPAMAAALKEQVTKSRGLPEVANWLRSQKVEFGELRGVRAAEQVSLDHLPRLQKMKDGELGLFESDERLQIVRLAARQAAPVDEAAATPRIQQFLFNRRLSDAVSEETKRLREKSNIEYVGEFAKGAPPAAPAPKAEPFQPAKPAAPNMEKGVRGLR